MVSAWVTVRPMPLLAMILMARRLLTCDATGSPVKAAVPLP
jgi:hypothetical protein